MAIFNGTTGVDQIFGTSLSDTINGLDGDDHLEGGLGADTINGGNGHDELFSSNDASPLGPEDNPLDLLWDEGTVADTLDGGAGDDWLLAGIDDTVRGGAGNDQIWLTFAGAASGVVADLTAAFAGGTSKVGKGSISDIEGYGTIIGSSYGDTITLTGSSGNLSGKASYWPQGVYAGAGDDVVKGGLEDDFLYGGAGADHLFGGEGDDLLASGRDPGSYLDQYDFVTIFPAWDDGTEIDVLEGGAGYDRGFIGLGDSFDGGPEGAGSFFHNDYISIWLLAATNGVTVDLRAVFADGESTVAGGVITHVTGFEAIQGSNFNDVINVEGGRFLKSDNVMAGLFGNAGADRMSGSGDGDIMFGGSGADVLIGRAGDDWLYAGPTDDYYAEYSYRYTRYYLNSDAADLESDKLFGGAGNDVLNVGVGDSVDGGSADDTLILDLSAATGPVKLDLTAAFSGGTSRADGASWRGLERYGQIIGSDHDDTIILGKARIAGEQYGEGTIYLQGGDDVAFGGRDGDTIFGQDGADSLSGMGGDDVLNGGYDADTLNGGDGDDRLDGDDDNDVLNGGAGDDVLVGGFGDDTLVGGKGIDLADYGGSGFEPAVTIDLAKTGAQDTIGAGIDRLSGIENVAGTYGNDTLSGDAHANVLMGKDGRDTLKGGGGDDVLIGGAGRDSLAGGAGRDTFVFDVLESFASRRDNIYGFASGTDHLAFDREAFTAFEGEDEGVIDAGVFVLGTAAANAQQVLIYDRAAGQLFYDADGSGAGAKLLIAVLGAGTAVTAQDILLV